MYAQMSVTVTSAHCTYQLILIFKFCSGVFVVFLQWIYSTGIINFSKIIKIA